MRVAAEPNRAMRVLSAVQGNTPTGNFKPCATKSYVGSWEGRGGYFNVSSSGFSSSREVPQEFSSQSVTVPVNRLFPAQGFSSPLFLKPPTYYTLTSLSSVAPGLLQTSLLDRQMVGRLKETPEAYIFVKSSTAVTTAEGILKDLLKLLMMQAELLKNGDDLTIRYYDGDDVAYPVEGGISFVSHSDFAWVQKQLFRRDREFDLGRLNERTLY